MRRFALALILLAASAASAATFTVNDLGDASDASAGNGTCATAGAVCTLRAAIEEANALAGADTIEFSVAGTIGPATALPSIVEQTTIDGTTMPGVILAGGGTVAIGIDFAAGSNGSLLAGLEITAFTAAGVNISASNVTVRDNWLHLNQDGISVFGTNNVIGGVDGQGNVISGNTRHGILVAGSGHSISDNFIGTDSTGAAGDGNGEDGVHVFSLATNITIGGSTGAENVISDNIDDGVHIDNSSSITVAGNFIGTDLTGMIRLDNDDTGIEISGSNDNIIGASGVTTLISGNFGPGVYIESGTGNVIDGCLIGTDITGLGILDNGIGVLIEDSSNTVGTTALGNVISGNFSEGVIFSVVTSGFARNNIIGLGSDGDTIVGNGSSGIVLDFVSGVTIEGNTLSGNGVEGIDVVDSTASSILDNVIGLNTTATSTRGNGGLGILVVDSSALTIGSTSAPNIISGNSFGGVVLAGATDSLLVGNRIGTDGTGLLAEANLGTGVELFDAHDNTITDNVVSNNDGHGIEMTFGSSNNTLLRNLVGVGVDLSAMGNFLDGVNVCDTVVGNVVGNGVAADGNIIRHNGANGIGVEPTALQGNTWAGNSIDQNEQLGIDIDIDGVTANDEDDPDTGANNIQNFPVITWAVTDATATWIQGTVNSTPSTALTLHFYSSPSQDSSGFGEGALYLGATNVTTDAGGDASFNFTGLPATIGHSATATATSADGTSEFSESSEIVAAPTVEFSASAYPVNEGDGSVMITVTRTGDTTGTSTVDFATSPNTATAVADYTHIAGTLTFAPTETSQTFFVTIVQDTTDEPLEQINLTLSNPFAASLGTPSTATIDIADDDPTPSITIDDVSLNEGNAGTTSFTFTVSLSNPSASTVTVDYATSLGSATAGTDYTAIPTTPLTFVPGDVSETITVDVSGDTTTESNETFFLDLSNASNASISDPQGQGTILNDDAPPTITINDVSLNEGNAGTTSFTFTVSLSNPSDTDVMVDYATANNTASSASDYTAIPTTTLTIPANTLSAMFTVNVSGDTTTESDETFFVDLTNANGASIGDDQGQGTILNDDAPPTITINDVSLNEGNAGTTSFTFTVSLSNLSDTDVTVDYATANNTASSGSDYTAIPTTTLTIPANTLSAMFTVNVAGDTTSEGNETFFVDLTNATGASIGDDQGLGTILNDDGTPSITINDVSLNEGDAGTTSFTFTVSISPLSGSDVTVDYATANNTASSASDYTAIPTTTLTIPANTPSATLTVNVAGDTTTEGNETFFVNLTNASGATISDDQGLGTILNDDAVPSITIDDVTLNEGDAGTTSFTFTVSLSGASASPITVDYTTANDTATAGSDYTAIPTTQLTFAPGDLAESVTVNVTGDIVGETDETFFVYLTNASGATIGDAQGIGTILNDDAFSANLSITKTSSSATFTPGQQITFTITVTNAGPNDATGVQVTDDLPAGTTYVSATPSSGACVGTDPVVCTFPTIVNGASETISLVVTANGSATITNTATVVAVEGDPNPANNSASAAISPFAVIPTLSEWGLLILAAALALAAMYGVR